MQKLSFAISQKSLRFVQINVNYGGLSESLLLLATTRLLHSLRRKKPAPTPTGGHSIFSSLYLHKSSVWTPASASAIGVPAHRKIPMKSEAHRLRRPRL